MPRNTQTTYTCDKCRKEFRQKSHYDKHRKNKKSCLPNVDPKKIIELAKEITSNDMPSKKTTKKVEDSIDNALMETINKTINRDALKEYIHDIHNMLRNNGAGYGMNALKVFMVFYALWILEKKDKLKEYKLENCRFSMLKELVDDGKYEDVVSRVQNNILDKFHSNKKLRQFFYYEIPAEVTGETMKELIIKIHNLPKVENIQGQLCGKVYEYFIGRDQTAISELGAYFTDRHITNYIFNLLDIQLNDDGTIPSMIDYFGGSGGFTVGYANYMNDKYPEIDWTTEINKIYHYDMNEDVTRYAGLELLSITNQIPDNKHIRVTNTFKLMFDRQFDYNIINPPYGGDNIKPSKDSQVRRTIVNYIKSLDNPTDKQKLQKRVFDEFIKNEKKVRDAHKVTLGCSSKFIKDYAKEHNLTGNDKEAVSLILLMATTAINGTACAVLKQGVFFDEKYKELRKHLIESFNVTHVIKIDNKQFENTGTTTSIIKFHNTPENTTKNIIFKELIVERVIEDKFEITDEGFVKLTECKGDIIDTYDKLKSEATIEELRAETGKKKKVQMYSLDGGKYGIKPLKCKKGYELQKIGELCYINPKSKQKAQPPFKLVKIGDIDKNTINSFIETNNVKEQQLVEYGDILISHVRPKSSKTLIIPDILENIEKYAFTMAKYRVKNKAHMNPMYVYAILYTLVDTFEEKICTGSQYPKFNAIDLETFEIPIPTTKQKIKEWSDKISKPYNEYIEKTELVKKLEQEVQEKIQKMIEEEECDEYTLGDICKMKTGIRVTMKDKYRKTGKYGYIRIGDLTNDNKMVYLDDSAYKQCKNCIVKTDDILISDVTDKSICKLVPHKWNGYVYYGSVIKITDFNINKYFLYYYFVSELFNKQRNTRTGSIQEHLTIELLETFIIQIPKNKLDSLDQCYDNIEKNKQESKEAEKQYKQLIHELKSDAIGDE